MAIFNNEEHKLLIKTFIAVAGLLWTDKCNLDFRNIPDTEAVMKYREWLETTRIFNKN